MNKKIWIGLMLIILVIIVWVELPVFIRLISKQGGVDPENITTKYDSKAKTGIFNNKVVEVPQSKIDDNVVLGENTTNETSSNKRIEVDLTKQRTYAYEGDSLVYNFLISSGTWDRTPTGDFKIWIKVKAQIMSGGSKELGTYYYLPNVQNVMFFYNEKTEKKLGYSFHQAYWHNNFGVPMSHGCINMTTADSALLYAWAEVGTPVKIYGKYQNVLPKI
jgi:lipoprotein-anchoring transpeptidase ErfK/SrfK